MILLRVCLIVLTLLVLIGNLLTKEGKGMITVNIVFMLYLIYLLLS